MTAWASAEFRGAQSLIPALYGVPRLPTAPLNLQGKWGRLTPKELRASRRMKLRQQAHR